MELFVSKHALVVSSACFWSSHICIFTEEVRHVIKSIFSGPRHESQQTLLVQPDNEKQILTSFGSPNGTFL